MNFNKKHTKWQTGMDQAYDAMLEAGDREALETEALEDEILQDKELFTRLALLYAWQTDGFLEFGVQRLRAERTPAYDNGWDEKPTNAEYWNFNDDRI